MKKREIPVMNVGISLIILIFMNICLAAFAVLSLENAVSDYSLSKKTAKHTTQYYEAVNNVQEQLAKKNQELREKAEAMMQEYQVENMDDIGCFIVLEPEEFTDFPIGEMEFVEMLFLEESMFLHGVRIIDESYGEDIYLPVEVVRC